MDGLALFLLQIGFNGNQQLAHQRTVMLLGEPAHMVHQGYWQLKHHIFVKRLPCFMLQRYHIYIWFVKPALVGV
jgi:hypothetical protein